MSASAKYSEALALVFKLAPKERLQLAKEVVSSVEPYVDAAPVAAQPQEGHWGQNLLRLLDEIGPIDLIHPEIEDPVEWVKQIRREQDQKRLGDWGMDE